MSVSKMLFLVSLFLIVFSWGDNPIIVNIDIPKPDTIDCKGDSINFNISIQESACCLLDSTYISIRSNAGVWHSYIDSISSTITDSCINLLSYSFWLDDSFFTLPDTIQFCVESARAQCSDTTIGMDSSVCCTIYVDCGEPIIDVINPRDSIYCPPESICFTFEDTCNLSLIYNSASILFNGINYNLTSDNLFFQSDTSDTIFPDTICFTFRDFSILCNSSVPETFTVSIMNEESCSTESTFTLNYYNFGPIAGLVDSSHTDTVYCNPETLSLFSLFDNCEGIYSNSIVITLNSETLSTVDDSILWLEGNLVKLALEGLHLDIGANDFCIVEARDSAECPLSDTICDSFFFYPGSPTFECDSLSGGEVTCDGDSILFFATLGDTCWLAETIWVDIIYEGSDGLDTTTFTLLDSEYLHFDSTQLVGKVVWDSIGFSPFCDSASICIRAYFSGINYTLSISDTCCFSGSFTTRCGNCWCDTTDTTHCCPAVSPICSCNDTIIYPAGDTSSGFSPSSLLYVDSAQVIIVSGGSDIIDISTGFNPSSPDWIFLTGDSNNIGISRDPLLPEGIYKLCIRLWFIDETSGDTFSFPPVNSVCTDTFACGFITYDCTPPELCDWESDMPDTYFCDAESVIVVLCDSVGVAWDTMDGTTPYIIIETDTFELTSGTLTQRNDSVLVFDISPGMLSDTGNVALEIHAEDLCGNDTVFYDSFYIECRGPWGEIIECLPDTEWYTCDSLAHDTIWFAIHDSIFGPVIDSTIAVIVSNGIYVDTLEYGVDSMYWTWDTSNGTGALGVDLSTADSIISAWAHLCSLAFCLSNSISDSLYSMINTDICCTVKVDCYDPYINSIIPSNTTWICDSIYTRFNVSDECSGVDSTSAHTQLRCPDTTIDIDSDEITYSSSYFWLDFNIDSLCTTLDNWDTISVCLISFSDFAGNPMSQTEDSCAEFVIDCIPPQVDSISDSTWFCDSTEITIYVSDSISGLATSNITIAIWGCDSTDTIYIDATEYLAGYIDSFTFVIDSTTLIPPCATGNSIQICVSGVLDEAGNEGEGCFSVYVYCERPEGHWIFPRPGCTNLKNEE